MTIGIAVVIVILALLVSLNAWGCHIRARGMKPIDAAKLATGGQKRATTPDGRQVAYCTYGVQDTSAPVVINMHGSGLEAGFERATYANICAQLGCRGIAISEPGCGFSDQKPGRLVKDWPAEDLMAVLDAEGVGAFFITGHSQGTPHAMAAALHFGNQCLGLGLNAPLLPTAFCKEVGVDTAIGTGSTPTSAQLEKTRFGWYFTMFFFVFGILPPSLASSMVKKGAPKLKADKALIARFENSMRRAAVRGTSGLTWESAQDTCFDWGFDVRDLRIENAVVWHADDDSAIPPAQGKWLAIHLNANFRHAAEGYGHMTYCAGRYQQPDHSMIAALLNGRKDNTAQ